MSNIVDSKPELTIFIDGGCHLCVMEMNHLRKKDVLNRINIVDILIDDFAEQYPHINTELAMAVLQGQLADGSRLSGLDVTHKAWSLVGQGWRTGFLRWPFIRPVADRFYYFFANNRNFISKVLTGKSRVIDCQQCNKYGR